VKTASKGRTTKAKDQSSKKKKKNNDKQTTPTNSNVTFASLSNSSTTHQQHHSAPPSQNQQSKTGLQAINENVEYLPLNGINEQNQQQIINSRFPRSSTVPYPAYATLRQGAGIGGGNHPLHPHYYYSDYPTFIHGTISPAQANQYFDSRQPLSSVNNNFQPISPHHHQQYSSRPVDVLKPTFLIVPKEAEQQLTAHLSASNSPVPLTSTTTKSSSKVMTKKNDTKKQEKSTAVIEQSSPTVRSVEVQTNNNSPSRATTVPVTTMDNNGHQHIGLVATPNPSPYVHFANVAYSTQSPSYLQDGPPETSIMQDEFININDYNQQSASIRSMPNISLAQGKNKNKKLLQILILY
jgi:hypothetical protein